MKISFIVILILLIVELLLAKICGPRSCTWGGPLYIYSGIFILIVSFALPLFWAPVISTAKGIACGSLFAILTVIVWIIGLKVGRFSLCLGF